MRFEELSYMRLMFLVKMSECFEDDFQHFFQDLMCHRYPDFVDVRTAGNLGDRGADGLLLHSGRLHACYAPQTFDASKMKTKFEADLQSALTKRNGQFATFTFVFPDRRGTHPDLSILLAEARAAHPGLNFETMGVRRLWNEVIRLERVQAEDLFGPIPIEELVYGIGLGDLEPLLLHLRDNRSPADPTTPIAEASALKMDYNTLSSEYREFIIGGMKSSYLVQQYYDGLIDETQHDEVATGFSDYYRQLRDRLGGESDDIMWELERYVMGSQHPKLQTLIAAAAVLAHFFERCHIFETPPADWQLPSVTAGAK